VARAHWELLAERWERCVETAETTITEPRMLMTPEAVYQNSYLAAGMGVEAGHVR
jgi:hypothetical protein